LGPLLYLVRKEWLLLRRDWHALGLLFLMPTVFILIMSLALQGLFAGHGRVTLSYNLLDQDRGPESAELARSLASHPEFRLEAATGPEEDLRAGVRAGKAQFLVLLPAGFGRSLSRGRGPQPIRLVAAPNVDPTLMKLFDATLREEAARVYVKVSMRALDRALGSSAGLGPDMDAMDSLVAAPEYEGSPPESTPTSVQQNVPAWLIFAMFFIAIPLSNTWVQERAQGTYARLLSLGLPRWKLLLGKLLPYMLVNLVQAVLMLAVGLWLVPLLGGDALSLGNAPMALALMVIAVSFAAVSYALLVANLARSSEEATLLTGVANLLFAVLGGIMVPRFVMPPALSALGGLSPMAWALEGFLDVFLRHGGLAQVFLSALLLAGFGCLSLGAAAMLFRRQQRG
jgi:ABC-2 type transport system permease protein